MCELIEVYTTFATDFWTWNVVDELTNHCLFFGNIEELEQWLIDNKNKYLEIK